MVDETDFFESKKSTSKELFYSLRDRVNAAVSGKKYSDSLVFNEIPFFHEVNNIDVGCFSESSLLGVAGSCEYWYDENENIICIWEFGSFYDFVSMWTECRGFVYKFEVSKDGDYSRFIRFSKIEKSESGISVSVYSKKSEISYFYDDLESSKCFLVVKLRNKRSKSISTKKYLIERLGPDNEITVSELFKDSEDVRFDKDFRFIIDDVTSSIESVVNVVGSSDIILEGALVLDDAAVSGVELPLLALMVERDGVDYLDINSIEHFDCESVFYQSEFVSVWLEKNSKIISFEDMSGFCNEVVERLRSSDAEGVNKIRWSVKYLSEF